MNKKIITALLILFIVSFGCIQPENNNKGNEPETIQKILEKGKTISNIQYDVVVSKPLPLTLSVHQKNEKYKIETSFLGQKSELIYDGKYAYNYDPVSGTYLQMELTESNAGGLEFSDLAEQALNDTEMKEIGIETVNGMNTIMIEFHYKASAEDESVKTKAWISVEYGIPVKLLMTTAEGEAEMEIKNIKLNSVQDSVFAVPEEKIKTIEELMNEYNFDLNSVDLNYG